MFPDRYIIKPNLVKTKVFRSAKNTNCQTEASADDYEFNINDAMEGKKSRRGTKGKSRDNTTFDNVAFNPFGPKGERKRSKVGLENQRESVPSKLGKSSIMMGNENDNNDMDMDNMDNDMEYNDNENYENEEDEYKRKMEFYKKMLKNEEDGGNQYDEEVNGK